MVLKGVGTVRLERSQKARRMNITLKPYKAIRVAIPYGVSFLTAERFVLSKEKWIRQALTKIRVQEQESEALAEKISSIDQPLVRESLVARLEYLANKHELNYHKVTIRNQRTRWGSCSVKNNISLNIRLALLPDELRDFIIIHELIHTKVKNHGFKFWWELEQIVPDARSFAKALNRYSHILV